jgi:hypothetical protein
MVPEMQKAAEMQGVGTNWAQHGKSGISLLVQNPSTRYEPFFLGSSRPRHAF